jgi:hypothetical protein
MDYASATPALGSTLGNTGDLWNGEIWNVPANKKYSGVIVRTPIRDQGGGNWQPNGASVPGGFETITDGSSNVLLISEKRLNIRAYDSGDWHDDRGWTDGWDPDVIRCTCIKPFPDGRVNHGSNSALGVTGFEFGSAHPAGMMALLADGSVRMLPFTIDHLVFDRLGNKEDGNPVKLD